MQLEITKIIDRYLMGELSEEDRLAFEARLSTNKALQQELALQRMIQEAAIRASFRSDVQQTARRYKLNRVMKWGAAGLGGLALIGFFSVWMLNSSQNSSNKSAIPVISQSMMEKMNGSAEFERLPIQYFSVPKEGDVFLSDQSVLLSVPKNAFLLGNKPYSGEAIVQFQEALTANEIVKAGLNTMTGTHLLETQGMFSIHAYTPAGQKLELNPAVGIYVQVPVDEYKDGMQLYDLVNLPNGKSDWQNPRALEKIPVPVAMTELDFYPTGYEKELDNLKWKQSKRQRDRTVSPVLSPAAKDRSTLESVPIAVESKETIGNIRVEASFPEGSKAMRAFISNELQYPEKAIKRNLQGVVRVTFMVDEVGQISDIRVASGAHELLAIEAMRIVEAMPRWIPAMNRYGAVKSQVELPITFSLEDSKVKRSGMRGGLMSYAAQSSQQQDTTWALISTAADGTKSINAPIISDTPCDYPHISPSRVLAFWKPTFNNTNLATREFEQRMKAIHGTCNNAVLQKYTSQLKKPLSQIDQEVADMGHRLCAGTSGCCGCQQSSPAKSTGVLRARNSRIEARSENQCKLGTFATQ
jgi:TonB family protein